MAGQTSRPVRGLQLLTGLLCFVSAGLQLNDPDPAAWVAIYGLGGVACMWPGRGTLRFLLASATAAAAWVWAGFLAPPTLRGGLVLSDLVKSMDVKTPQVELGRELLGLLLLAVALTLVAVSARRRREPS